MKLNFSLKRIETKRYKQSQCHENIHKDRQRVPDWTFDCIWNKTCLQHASRPGSIL